MKLINQPNNYDDHSVIYTDNKLYSMRGMDVKYGIINRPGRDSFGICAREPVIWSAKLWYQIRSLASMASTFLDCYMSSDPHNFTDGIEYCSEKFGFMFAEGRYWVTYKNGGRDWEKRLEIPKVAIRGIVDSFLEAHEDATKQRRRV